MTAGSGWIKGILIAAVVLVVVRFVWKAIKSRVIRRMATYMESDDPVVRRVAAEQLGLLGGGDAIRMLNKALADRDERVRAEAASALARLGQRPEAPVQPRAEAAGGATLAPAAQPGGARPTLLDQTMQRVAKGDLGGAMALAQQALSRRFETQAAAHRVSGDWQGELDVLKALESTYLELGDEKGALRALESQARILREHGSEAEAESIAKGPRTTTSTPPEEKAEMISNLGATAAMLRAIGDHDGALDQLKQMESLSREMGDKENLVASLLAQAEILVDRGEKSRALGIIREATHLYRELNSPQALSECLSNQAEILRSLGDFHQSLAIHHEAELIFRQAGLNDRLMVSLACQGTIRGNLHDPDGAAVLFAEAAQLARSAGKKENLARYLGSQAVLLLKSDPRQALGLAEEAVQIAAEMKMIEFSGQIRSAVDIAKARLTERVQAAERLAAPPPAAATTGENAHASSVKSSSQRGKPAHRAQERVVRVFISSTFRDMQEERDLLVKHVFPELRRRCRERAVEFVEVDLRWGVTEEQAERGEVLPICLTEIEKCRPFFIGLLGERYGWVPERLSAELFEAHPWLENSEGRSVTELEILHGVLRSPEMARRSFFYFRDPAYLDRVPQERISDFKTESAAARSKLDQLKSRIRASGLMLVETYPTPDSAAQHVLDDLWRVIDEEFPAGSEPDPLDREAAEQEAFARSRAKVYVGRQQDSQRLNSHVDGDAPPLVVLGEPGTGKSALIANWAAGFRPKHPGDFLLTHFIGSTPQSTDWAAMLRRIMEELKRHFDLQMEVPEEQDALREASSNWLHIAADRGRVVLAIDALDQLEDRNSAPDLVWLPLSFPANVRLILTTLPGRSLEAIEKRGWPTFTISGLREDERGQLIRAYLGHYTKSLDGARAARIAAAEQTKNPLYLRSLLEELRIFGIHEKLDDRIEHYLDAPTVSALYDRILDRYEQDFETSRPGLVRDAMSFIWAARAGLTEAELLELLGAPQNPLPRAVWSPLYLAAEESLVSRSGKLTFFHAHFRQAVENRYLPTGQERVAAHLRLAGYFRGRGVDPRAVHELPWQLDAAQDWASLFDLFKDLTFFNACWVASLSEVKAYWAKIEKQSTLRLVDAYRPLLEAPAGHADDIANVASLLFSTGHLDEAVPLQEHVIQHLRQTQEKDRLAGALGNLASISFARADFTKAIALQKEAEQIYRENGNMPGLARALSLRARAHLEQGELDAAQELYSEAEVISRAWSDRPLRVACLGNLATVHYYRKDLDRAMQLFQEHERAARELGDQEALACSLLNQANILIDRREFAEAMRLLKQEERICQEIGDRRTLARSFVAQACILDAQGRHEESAVLYERAEGICRETGDKSGLARLLKERGQREHPQARVEALVRQATALKAGGDLARALDAQCEIERLCREMGEMQAVAACLGNQGTIHHARNDLDKAMACYQEQERLCREEGEKKVLADSLFNQSLILKLRGDRGRAMELLKEAGSLARQTGNLNVLAATKTLMKQ